MFRTFCSIECNDYIDVREYLWLHFEEYLLILVRSALFFFFFLFSQSQYILLVFHETSRSGVGKLRLLLCQLLQC